MERLRLPRLYPIVDAETLSARRIDLRSFVEQLREAGVTLIQYRDKTGTHEQILRNADLISDVFKDTEATLVMNDSPELARLAGWRAVHVGQNDLAISETRTALPRSIVGCSTHSPQQVVQADAAGADYIAIGPVFATASKRNPDAVVGIEGVRQARALTSIPLVAIGGITPEDAASVIEAGADTVAVIGALLQPGATPAEWVNAFLRNMLPL
ncbi:MAG TPA: thiamine phosphate synthase [Edaphobacter sp.]|nr:thiamine phosphate synthase [Edaphobacter sp.]